MFPHWPDEVEDTITRSVKTAEAKALLTIKMLGMEVTTWCYGARIYAN